MKKALKDALKRLQRMLLWLQCYTLEEEYHKGKESHLADTLSRAPLPEREVHSCRVSDEFSQVNHNEALPVGEQCWKELRQASSEDSVLCDLKKIIQEGWPQHKKI